MKIEIVLKLLSARNREGAAYTSTWSCGTRCIVSVMEVWVIQKSERSLVHLTIARQAA